MRKERQANLEEIIVDEREAMRLLSADTEIAIDLETGGLSPWRDPIAVVSLYGAQSDVTAVLHIRGYLSPELRRFLSRSDVLWIGHNVAGFDMLFLANSGVSIFGTTYFDTLVAEQVTLSTGRRDVRVNLQDTVARRLGTHLKKGLGASSWMADTLSQEQWQYCASDVWYLPRLRAEQLAKVEGTTVEQAMAFEQSLIPIIARIVLNGMPLDLAELDQWRREMVTEAVAANKYLGEVRPGLNVNSSKQIIAMFDELHEVAITSCDKSTLADLGEYESEVADLAKALTIARRERKRGSFYDDDWVAKHVYQGRVHPKFWQASTDTFRFSSSDPNMQQIPQEGRRIFGGVPGHTIVAVDYSQLEVRVAAYISRDEALIEALTSSDMHSTIASGIFLKPVEEISSKERKLAKAATFSLLFGGSPQGIVTYAKRFGSKLSIEEAEVIYVNFFKRFQGLARDRKKASQIGYQGRPVTLTLASGARRVLVPENGKVRPSQILNTLVQSRAAIGMKHAIIESHKRGLTSYIGLTVHDELVGDVPDAEVAEFTAELKAAMITGMANVTGDTPIAVEEKIGKHWKS